MTDQNNTPKEIALRLPHTPGIYKFFDKDKMLLYVGKAKDLKNRVNSYFNQVKQHNRKTQKLVSQISFIEFTLVNNEFDALLLENNLIKNYQPKYNILLKDDKSYPYICVTDEPFPKVISTRQPEKKQGQYYGPFTNLKVMNSLLDLLRELYTIRTCHLHLTQKNILQQKFNVCLEYHIKNCKGPCEGLQNEEDYNKDIEQIHHILKGNIHTAKKYLKEKMMKYAEILEFEKAEECKQKLTRLETFQSKSLVVNPKIKDVDVFSIITEDAIAYINYLKIKNGAIVHTQNTQIKKKLEETEEEILTLIIINLRKQFSSEATEIISNVHLNIPLEDVNIHTPKIGDKKKLLDLSLKNVFYYQKDILNKKNNLNKPKHNQAVIELQKVLNMPTPPQHIECFDNSNIQGTNPVASMVYFKDGKPYKQEYRHFNIKTVIGPDDFSSMKEIVTRRYKRLQEEEQSLPDLIIIDGGKGQLSSACQALQEVNLYGKIKIIGIAKKLEEIYLPEDDIPLHINKKSLALKLIQRARDEAHRFAIEFHRLKRSNNSIKSQLENIKGIGESTIITLLKHFKTIKAIKESTEKEIIDVVGKSKARLIKEGLK